MTSDERTDELRSLLLEPFVTPCASLDWRMGHAYWQRRGAAAFTLHEVPNGATNDGVRAARAAHLLLESLREADALPERIIVVEYGMGSGLFARIALDTFKRLCQEHDLPAYERLTWYASEWSERTLRDAQDSGVFAEHASVVQLVRADATRPDALTTLDGAAIQLTHLHAAFFNYILDVLPFTTLMRQGEQWMELRVQTRLNDLHLASRLTGLDSLQLQALAADPDPGAQEALHDLAPLLGIERAWFPADIEQLDPDGHIRAFVQDHLDPWLRKHDTFGALQLTANLGALQTLQTLAPLLDPTGFLLISDFGWDRIEQAADTAEYQRFGLSTAVGLLFPLLDHALTLRTTPPLQIAAPRNDERCNIHTRLLSTAMLGATADALDTLFDGERIQRAADLLTEAREAAAEAHPDPDRVEALYAEAHAIAPESWSILSEWAGVANTLQGDPERALDLASRALAINPITSSLAWNELGDAHFNRGRFEEAHQAYLRAHQANPEHPRASLNLAWTWSHKQRFDEALQAVHRAIELDRHGLYRSTLLELHGEILQHRTTLHDKLTAWTRTRQLHP